MCFFLIECYFLKQILLFNIIIIVVDVFLFTKAKYQDCDTSGVVWGQDRNEDSKYRRFYVKVSWVFAWLLRHIYDAMTLYKCPPFCSD